MLDQLALLEKKGRKVLASTKLALLFALLPLAGAVTSCGPAGRPASPAAAAQPPSATVVEGRASDSFVAWAREQAIAVGTVEPGRGFDDLQPLKKLVGSARIVGLGESVHAAHEFFKVRHRLFEFLVETMGFTALAMETGFAEAVAINEYVLGRANEPEQWKDNWFTWGIGAEQELLALVRWMRRYNEDPAHTRKLRFYGVDVPVGYSSPRKALDGALAYLDEVDPPDAAVRRSALLPLVSRFLGDGGGVRGVSLKKYADLPIAVRDAYTTGLADLVARFDDKRVDYLRRSSKDPYEWAYRQAIVARQLDHAYRLAASDRTWESGSFDLPEPVRTARDRSMADNLLWALEREGPNGRVAFWGHNVHVQKFPVRHGDVTFTPMGRFLQFIVADEYLSVGFTYGQGSGSGWASYQTHASEPAKSGSLDAELARVELPMFVLDLRSLPRAGLVRDWLNRLWEQRESGPDYLQVNPLEAWDAVFHIDRISPAYVGTQPQ